MFLAVKFSKGWVNSKLDAPKRSNWMVQTIFCNIWTFHFSTFRLVTFALLGGPLSVKLRVTVTNNRSLEVDPISSWMIHFGTNDRPV